MKNKFSVSQEQTIINTNEKKTSIKSADLATFTEEILNGKLHFFVQCMDKVKASDYLDHLFLMYILKKSGFGENFMTWIETVTKNQECCVINSGKTTQYLKPQRGACQGDPIC